MENFNGRLKGAVLPKYGPTMLLATKGYWPGFGPKWPVWTVKGGPSPV